MAVRESPTSEWLPIAPTRAAVVTNGDFPANVTSWSAGTFPSGSFTIWTLLATYGSLGAGNDNFNNPAQLAIDAPRDFVYIADLTNNRVIRRVLSTGVYSAQIGSLSSANGVAVDASGNIYVVHGANLISSYTSALALRWGPITVETLGTVIFRHICTDGTHIYAVDNLSGRVHKRLCSTGAAVAIYGTAGSGNDQFSNPTGIDTDGTHLWIGDTTNTRIKKITVGLVFVSHIPTSSNPGAVALDGSGNIAACLSFESAVRRYNASTGVLFDTIPIGSTGPSGVDFAAGDVAWISDVINDNVTKWDETVFVRSAAFVWNNAVAVGLALGALALTVTNGDAGSTANVVNSKYFPINDRDSVTVAASVRTSNVNLTPRLQLLFYDAASALLSTVTESDWTPAANTNYRRGFSARVPSNATQYRVGFLASVDAGPLTATTYLDDVTTGTLDLYVKDLAMGQIKVEVQARARWLT